MKKLIFLSIFLLFSLLCNAQILKFRAEAVATRLYNHTEERFDDFGDWEKCNIVIVLNETKETINVYSELEQEYLIISGILGNEGKTLTFDCIDRWGGRETLEILRLSSEIYHLYIRMEELQIVYQMRKL